MSGARTDELHIPYDEVLRYLGYHTNTRPDEKTSALLKSCTGEILKAARPRSIWSAFEIDTRTEDEVRLLRAGKFILRGQDICRHLEGCSRCVMMAATIGSEVDRLIASAQVLDMLRAVILDCCATAAIEDYCDHIQADIAEWAAGCDEEFEITSRYSPGYGDLPIESQRDWTALLDTSRKIGLAATGRHILIPRKSVTAVIGLYRGHACDSRVAGGCIVCAMRESCPYRKGGKHCGQ